MKIRPFFAFQKISLLLILFSLLAELAFAEYWPQENWRTASPESQGMSSEVLSDMLDALWKNEYKIDSIIVIRNGRLVLESYKYPAGPHFKHQIYSCTKSISSALIGIAVEKGYIGSVDRSLLEFFPEKSATIGETNKRNITLKHVLTMATGLKCEDTKAYDYKGLREMWQADDWVQYMIDLPLIELPGSRFVYCNGASSLLTAIIQKTTGQTAFDFARQHLFSPLGIHDIHWKSHNGLTIGYSDITMRPLDMARFGYLFIKEGRWNEKQILPTEWVIDSTTRQIDNSETYGYGYQWWIMGPDIFAARGAYGQRIFALKEQNMVVVFTSQLDDVRSQVPEQLLYDYILPSVKSEKPLPENEPMRERLDSLITLLQKTEDQEQEVPLK
ncbi:serine hydrolase [Desulfopila sp. IMCC35008]|uniref:serine hydrolase domain-containing protein n=1 Tax=Desulfopila sp. IMCC35008 TaxID=2653858 RepID=UPI0013D589B2|nr:serine hydrolase [Desulfopila sp. IMCC35008]